MKSKFIPSLQLSTEGLTEDEVAFAVRVASEEDLRDRLREVYTDAILIRNRLSFLEGIRLLKQFEDGEMNLQLLIPTVFWQEDYEVEAEEGCAIGNFVFYKYNSSQGDYRYSVYVKLPSKTVRILSFSDDSEAGITDVEKVEGLWQEDLSTLVVNLRKEQIKAEQERREEFYKQIKTEQDKMEQYLEEAREEYASIRK